MPDFENLYAGETDPWQVLSSFYEQRKLGVLLACLGRQRYRTAWDPSCGTGELALRLAHRCTTVLATDLASSAVRLATTRCESETGVTVQQLALPTPPPTEMRFDLVVLSEFMFYLDADARAATLTLVDEWATDEAEIIAVHWRHHPHDAWISGVEIEAEIIAFLLARGWSHAVQHDDQEFVLDCFHREGRA